jgi:ABC-type polysaccharide/polyol phosphate export permease
VQIWQGKRGYLLTTLILKDFRVRYRRMSLGVLWSLMNPLITMAVLTFVFTIIYPSPERSHFPVFLLCGIVPYNFFTLAWLSGTVSIVESAHFIKRVPVPREIVPIAAVLSNCIHLSIQIALLLGAAILFGLGININWFWLPVVWALEIVFVCGLAFVTSAANVYIRDTRYFVESLNAILFWLVPIFYSFAVVPSRYRELYQYNPVAALVLSLRNIILEGTPPPTGTLLRLAGVSLVTFTLGWAVFRRMRPTFFEHI